MKRGIILILLIVVLCGVGAATISGLEGEYTIGDTFTIVLTNSEYTSVLATLEANEFEPGKENLNFIRTYAGSSKGKDDEKKTWTISIDTTNVPVGTYTLVVKGTMPDGKTVVTATEKVTLIEPIADAETPEVAEEPASAGPVTTSGFGILSLLGLLAVPILVKIHRKK